MITWRLLMEYDGTRYRGWQEQKQVRTVAGEVRRAAERFLQSEVEIQGAGRTDAGVHAIGQVARMRSHYDCKIGEFCRGVNQFLPEDIHLLRAQKVAGKFDARRDAEERYYLYQISQRRTAFAKRYVWWVKDELDIEKMMLAAAAIVGRHDFAAFCEAGEEEKSTQVEVERTEIGLDGSLILFRIGASHFLWKMVRRLVGMLVEVGRGKTSVAEFGSLLRLRGRDILERRARVAEKTAPPSGLGDEPPK